MLTEAEIQVLFAARYLPTRYGAMAGWPQGTPPTRDVLEAFGHRWMHLDKVDWSEAWSRLRHTGLLAEMGDTWQLTPQGVQVLATIEPERPFWLFEYDNYYRVATRSQAHAVFCETAYGIDLCQHGLADLPQMETLAAEMKGRFLDLGCGTGAMTEWLAERTDGDGDGLDLSRHAIARARTRRWGRYFVGNMNRLELEPRRYDWMVSFDTLYYVDSLENTLRSLLPALAPHGHLGLFYTHWNDAGPDALRPDGTPLGSLLAGLGMSFRTYDFTEAEHRHWALKKQTLERLQPSFQDEGNDWLYQFRYSEAVRYADWNPAHRSRHLYIAWQ